jgi:REP element-mobilizing transposase RayT
MSKRFARRSVRLPAYDYGSMGAYFVTMCTHNRSCLFRTTHDGTMRLSEWGHAVEDCWKSIPAHHRHVMLDAFVVMPNHIHGVLLLGDSPAPGAARRAPTPNAFGPPMRGALSTVLRSFKSASTNDINRIRGTPGAPLWQRSYYEHVIRDEADLFTVRQYIQDNPARWDMDEENPSRSGRPARNHV